MPRVIAQALAVGRRIGLASKARPTRRRRKHGPVAQRSEQGTHNPLVAGSIPAGPTRSEDISDLAVRHSDYIRTTIASMNGTKTEVAPGVWRLRIYVGRNSKGFPVQRSKTIRIPGAITKPGAGKRLADRELANMIAEVSNGRAAVGAETVDNLLDRFLEHSQSLGRSPTTLRKYRSIADSVVRPQLGEIKLTKLTAQDLDRLYAKLSTKGNRATTVRRVHALLSVSLHQAKKWKLVSENVALDATPPPIYPERAAAPTPDEVRPRLSRLQRPWTPGWRPCCSSPR